MGWDFENSHNHKNRFLSLAMNYQKASSLFLSLWFSGSLIKNPLGKGKIGRQKVGNILELLYEIKDDLLGMDLGHNRIQKKTFFSYLKL